MVENKNYYANDVCEILNISNYTLSNWYRWERKCLKDGGADKPYLPQPNYEMDVKGKPRYWTSEQIKQLESYKKNIVHGRNGKYGKYTNPLHKEKE